MSTPVYVPRGSAWRDAFLYLSVAGAGVTGKSSWTTRLSKDGANLAVAGLTISEVSAANNPGLYAILINATTGFVAIDGTYNLSITDPADVARVWEQTYVVNTDGLPSTQGVAFTATASNGRAMSGASPLQGATVVITSGSAVYAVLTTSALGLWGPVYFTADGTYGITIQAAGYTSASGSITISGSGTIAAGPGTDLALTASTLNPLAASELWAYFTRQARDVSGNKADTERKQGVQDALEMLAKEGQWSWLLRRGYLALKGAVTYTVTLTQSSAVVTTAGTFASWAAEGRAFMQSQVIDVLTRDSDTQLTLDAPWVGTTGSYSMNLFRDEYALPDNTLWFHQLIPFQRWAWGGNPDSPEVFFQRQSAMIYGQQFPSCWTVHAGNLCLYPYPSADATLAFTYYAQPPSLTSGADIADWDPAQVEVLRRAIDVQVVNRYGSCAGGEAGVIMGRYKEALARARTTDREPTSAGNALEDTDAFDMRLGRTWRQRPRG